MRPASHPAPLSSWDNKASERGSWITVAGYADPRRPDVPNRMFNDTTTRSLAERLSETGQTDPLMDIIKEGGPYHASPRTRGFLLTDRMHREGRADQAAWLEENDGAPRPGNLSLYS